MKWTSSDIPDQSDRQIIVTGANSGIGYETALALTGKGAALILACRNLNKAAEARDSILAEVTDGSVEVMQLDLGSLRSIAKFAEQYRASYEKLDLLIANAGVMMPPQRESTREGFELQFGTNHLGHFALIGRLLPVIMATPGSRVVVVASSAHRMAEFDIEDLNWQRRRYKKMQSYGQSKLANLLYTYELQRRLTDAGSQTIATAAHPGWTATNLQRHSGLIERLNPFFAMPAWQGALPTLYAATHPDLKGGEYIGPDGFIEMKGYPEIVSSNKVSKDPELAQQLWRTSELMTGFEYPLDD